MFEPSSRYYLLPNLLYRAPDGREIAYKQRRILPRAEGLKLLAEVIVAQSDRLDLVTARTLGPPELFWRVADANNAMDPFSLIAHSGHRLRIPLP
jgi:hypothetical protein